MSGLRPRLVLAPCPFCGHAGYAVHVRANFAHIRCDVCRAHVGWEIDDDYETARRWNQRPREDGFRSGGVEACRALKEVHSESHAPLLAYVRDMAASGDARAQGIIKRIEGVG